MWRWDCLQKVLGNLTLLSYPRPLQDVLLLLPSNLIYFTIKPPLALPHKNCITIWWCEKNGTIFSGAQFQNRPKLWTILFEHAVNHILKLQSHWTANVEMTVAQKLSVQKSNIVDNAILSVYGMHSAWHTAVIKKSQVFCGAKCHFHHPK